MTGIKLPSFQTVWNEINSSIREQEQHINESPRYRSPCECCYQIVSSVGIEQYSYKAQQWRRLRHLLKDLINSYHALYPLVLRFQINDELNEKIEQILECISRDELSLIIENSEMFISCLNEVLEFKKLQEILSDEEVPEGRNQERTFERMSEQSSEQTSERTSFGESERSISTGTGFAIFENNESSTTIASEEIESSKDSENNEQLSHEQKAQPLVNPDNPETSKTCKQCDSKDTPEWRRGPDGPRSLCNACGLFYGKLCKKFGKTEAGNVMEKRRSSGNSLDRRVPII